MSASYCETLKIVGITVLPLSLLLALLRNRNVPLQSTIPMLADLATPRHTSFLLEFCLLRVVWTWHCWTMIWLLHLLIGLLTTSVTWPNLMLMLTFCLQILLKIHLLLRLLLKFWSAWHHLCTKVLLFHQCLYCLLMASPHLSATRPHPSTHLSFLMIAKILELLWDMLLLSCHKLLVILPRSSTTTRFHSIARHK